MDKINCSMIRKLWEKYPSSAGIMFDIGGYDVNGNVATVLTDEKVYSLDLVKQDGLAVVADAHLLPIKSNSCVAVWSTSTLQYVKNPFMVVAEIRRILMPDGIAYLEAPTIETPGLIGRHWNDQEQDSFRIYPKGMRSLLECAKFDRILYVGMFSRIDRVWGVAVK